MKMISTALSILLLSNPIGILPIIASLLKNIERKRQYYILLRECIFSMFLAYFFLYTGNIFFKNLNIELFSIQIGGSLIIFLISLNMLFPTISNESIENQPLKEPYIVPIATPLIVGGGVIVSLMISIEQNNLWIVSGAVFIAWTVITAIVLSAIYLPKLIGKEGLIVLEQTMGMIFMMLSTELFLSGIRSFLLNIPTTMSTLVST